MIMDLLEARAKMQRDMRTNKKTTGYVSEIYFELGKFVEHHFTRLHPAGFKREKVLVNFIWSIINHKQYPLVNVISKLLQQEYNNEDTMNLLMTKDFTEQYLKKIMRNYVDLTAAGHGFRTFDSLVELAREVVQPYDDNFRVMFEETFFKKRGDSEYMTIYDFFGHMTDAFHDLRAEGVEKSLKKVVLCPKIASPSKQRGPGRTHVNELPLLSQRETGFVQDRSKSKEQESPIKWFMWSDYPKKSTVQNSPLRELTSKEVGDFFSVDMDAKIEKLKVLSAQKKKGYSPYSLTDKKRAHDLELGNKVRADQGTTEFNPLSSRKAQDKYFQTQQLEDKDDLDVFNVFDKLGSGSQSKQEKNYFRDTPTITQKLAGMDKANEKKLIQEREKAEMLKNDKKMTSIFGFLEDELKEKCNK